MDTSTSLFVAIIYWKLGYIDALTLARICINAGSQYIAIVTASAVGSASDVSPKLLLKPILGLATGIRYIILADTAGERSLRILNFVSLLSTSVISALTTDPATNGGIGATIAANIGFWTILNTPRGGGGVQVVNYGLIPLLKDFVIKDNSIKNLVVPPLLSPAQMRQMQFNHNCNEIMQNIIREQTARRSAQGYVKAAALKAAAQELKFSPTYLVPIVSTQLNITASITLMGWVCIGGVMIFATISGGLYLFHREEHKRSQNLFHREERKRSQNLFQRVFHREERKRHQKDKIVIDVNASIDD